MPSFIFKNLVQVSPHRHHRGVKKSSKNHQKMLQGAVLYTKNTKYTKVYQKYTKYTKKYIPGSLKISFKLIAQPMFFQFSFLLLF
jgi:hypothetical protein